MFWNWPSHLIRYKVTHEPIFSNKEITNIGLLWDLARERHKISPADGSNQILTRNKDLVTVFRILFKISVKITSLIRWLISSNIAEQSGERKGWVEGSEFPPPEPHKGPKSFYIYTEGGHRAETAKKSKYSQYFPIKNGEEANSSCFK